MGLSFANENWDIEHDEAEAETAGTPIDLKHGADCNSCNNAILNDMEANHRRSDTFGQAINNLRSYRTDQNIHLLAGIMRRKRM